MATKQELLEKLKDLSNTALEAENIANELGMEFEESELSGIGSDIDDIVSRVENESIGKDEEEEKEE